MFIIWNSHLLLFPLVGEVVWHDCDSYTCPFYLKKKKRCQYPCHHCSKSCFLRPPFPQRCAGAHPFHSSIYRFQSVPAAFSSDTSGLTKAHSPLSICGPTCRPGVFSSSSCLSWTTMRLPLRQRGLMPSLGTRQSLSYSADAAAG